MKMTYPIAGLLALVACQPSAVDKVAASAADPDPDAAAAPSPLRCSGEMNTVVPAEPFGKMKKVDVGDFTFDVRTAGPKGGDLVLLLHGFPQTSLAWSAQMSVLAAEGYRAVAPNQRGYSPGARPADARDYGLAALAQDVLSLADALKAQRFHLVGHDWGAVIAWVVSRIAPDRVRSLTAVSFPHPDAFAEERSKPRSCQARASSYIAQLASEGSELIFQMFDSAMLRGMFREFPQDRIDAYLDFFSAPGALTGALNWYRASAANSAGADAPALGAITVPTLYVWGDAETGFCRETAERTSRFVDAPYAFEVLEGSGHWIPELEADALNALLLGHLSKYGAGAK